MVGFGIGRFKGIDCPETGQDLLLRIGGEILKIGGNNLGVQNIFFCNRFGAANCKGSPGMAPYVLGLDFSLKVITDITCTESVPIFRLVQATDGNRNGF